MAPKTPIILKALLFHAELALWLVALVMLIAGRPGWALTGAMLALGTDVAGRRWIARSPVPMPYFMRWVLLGPRGQQSPAQLQQVLRPRSGERILEIGPGVGVHALPVAASLQPEGVLDVLDVQQGMLDDLMRRAAGRGLTNIVPHRGDARHLPYGDATFDAAYLVSVLGEIPDVPAALRQLRRVLKPDARLVVSEIFVDPDFIPLRRLTEMAKDAGLTFERQRGPRFAYTTRCSGPRRKAETTGPVPRAMPPIRAVRTARAGLHGFGRRIETAFRPCLVPSRRLRQRQVAHDLLAGVDACLVHLGNQLQVGQKVPFFPPPLLVHQARDGGDAIVDEVIEFAIAFEFGVEIRAAGLDEFAHHALQRAFHVPPHEVD